MAAPQIEGLVWSLRHGVSRTSAAAVLRGLAVYSYAKVAIAEAGGIPPLVQLLRDGSEDAKVETAAALRNLTHGSDANKVAIAEAGGIPLLVQFLRDGGAGTKKWSAGALRNLASNNAANRVVIAEAGGVSLLVQLLRDGCAEAKFEAWAALCNLSCNNDANKVAIAEAVGLEAIVQLARGGRVTVDYGLVVENAGVPAKRKAALVVAALLRACVPEELRSRVDVQHVIRGVIGPYL